MYVHGEFDVLVFGRHALMACLLGAMYSGATLDVALVLASLAALVALCLARPPLGSVLIDERALRLRRGWRHRSIPRDAIRSVRPVDIGGRLMAGSFAGGRDPRNEWRVTLTSQGGVELTFRSDLPARLKVRLPDEHTFRVISGDPDGLLRALESGRGS